MTRAIGVAAGVLAVGIVLAGCGAAAKTDAEWCGTITGVWDKFETTAQTPGRADADIIERRDAVLTEWGRAAEQAPEWTRDTVTPALDALQQFADSDTSMAEQTHLYRVAADGVEAIRAQCSTDGNL